MERMADLKCWNGAKLDDRRFRFPARATLWRQDMLGRGRRLIENWPEKSRESALRVIDQYGEPDEVTESQLIWHKRGLWRQIIASKYLYPHNFPAPHYALFALEPKDDETAEKGPRPNGGHKIVRAKLEGKSVQAKTAVVQEALGKVPLRKSALALGGKRVRAPSSSAA